MPAPGLTLKVEYKYTLYIKSVSYTHLDVYKRQPGLMRGPDRNLNKKKTYNPYMTQNLL